MTHPAPTRAAAGHTGWCDPAACDVQDVDPRHTGPAVSWSGDGPGPALGLAVTRIDYTDLGGGPVEHSWVHTLTIPLADATVRDGHLVLELSEEDADMLRARFEENRARMDEVRERD